MVKKLIIAAIAFTLVAAPVAAQEVPGNVTTNTTNITEDNDVNISDNQVVVVTCVQSQNATQTNTQVPPVVVEGSDAVDETPAVQDAVQTLEQKNCEVAINIKSNVNPSPATSVVEKVTEKVIEKVASPTAEVTPTPEAEGDIPSGPPTTGHAL